jgi:hypothetical protein
MADETIYREEAQRYVNAALRQRNDHADVDLQKIIALEAALEEANRKIAALTAQINEAQPGNVVDLKRQDEAA